jgi:hypothetical protein
MGCWLEFCVYRAALALLAAPWPPAHPAKASPGIAWSAPAENFSSANLTHHFSENFWNPKAFR